MRWLLACALFFTIAVQAFQVRVLLEKHAHHQGKVFKLGHVKGFTIQALHDEACRYDFSDTVLTIEVKNNVLYINGRKVVVDSVKISPADMTPLGYESYYYGGFFIVLKKEDCIYIINSLDLEDYVCSVVRWESWPGWPLEVNKAFAIACRSYVVAQVVESRSKKLPYDIKCTNIHQTYKGVHDFDVIHQAVEQTCGVIMTYNNKPIFAMYDCCCGGIIPAQLQGVDFKSAPYLARQHVCHYCKDCKLFSWKVTYKVKDFHQLLEDTLPKKAVIKDVKVSKKDKAHIVQEVAIKTTRQWFTLTGKKIYSLCKKIKSFCFSVKKHEDTIVFEGRGYGHHLGICQWGAWKMVKQGWKYRTILEFFYCGISFKQIEEYK